MTCDSALAGPSATGFTVCCEPRQTNLVALVHCATEQTQHTAAQKDFGIANDPEVQNGEQRNRRAKEIGG